MTGKTEGQERVAVLQGLRQVVESAVEPQVSWENRFDQSIRTVRFSVSGAPRMQRFAHGYYNDNMLFEPKSVELVFRNGKRRAVTATGRRVLKSGQLGLRTAESYYLTTRDDEHMPEWLKRLVAEVSS